MKCSHIGHPFPHRLLLFLLFLTQAENISVLFRIPWELLLNPSLHPSLCAVLFLSTGAAFVQC